MSSWTARFGSHAFECSCPTSSRMSRIGREARGPEACRCQGWSWLAPQGRPLPPHPTSLNLQPHLKSKTWVSTLLTDRNTLQLHSTRHVLPSPDCRPFFFCASHSLPPAHVLVHIHTLFYVYLLNRYKVGSHVVTQSRSLMVINLTTTNQPHNHKPLPPSPLHVPSSLQGSPNL